MNYEVIRVLCKGGPHGDFYHEVEEGFGIPDGMGLPDFIDENTINYFKRDETDEEDIFYFTHAEKMDA